MERGRFQTLLVWVSLFHYLSASSKWTREPLFDNVLPLIGYNINSRSRINCGMACSTNNTCVSFFSYPGQYFNCQLHSKVLNFTQGLPAVPEAKYYILNAVLPAGPHSTSLPPFTCPPDDTIFRTVLLDNGKTFTYKVHNMFATQSEAADECARQGSFLARVNTIEEMNTLLMLMNCTGYGGIDYWVDGSNADAVDFFSPDAWVMSNGELVPMTSHFWGQDSPNGPTTQHCIRMRAAINYMWDDSICENVHYFICEK